MRAYVDIACLATGRVAPPCASCPRCGRLAVVSTMAVGVLVPRRACFPPPSSLLCGLCHLGHPISLRGFSGSGVGPDQPRFLFCFGVFGSVGGVLWGLFAFGPLVLGVWFFSAVGHPLWWCLGVWAGLRASTLGFRPSLKVCLNRHLSCDCGASRQLPPSLLLSS
jgi:hypothetical protein